MEPLLRSDSRVKGNFCTACAHLIHRSQSVFPPWQPRPSRAHQSLPLLGGLWDTWGRCLSAAVLNSLGCSPCRSCSAASTPECPVCSWPPVWVFGFLSPPPVFSVKSSRSCQKIRLASAADSPWEERGEGKRNFSAIRTDYFVAPEQSVPFTKYLFECLVRANHGKPRE